MTANFIYVYKKTDRDILKELGYCLLKQDDKNSVYVFAFNEMLTFALNNVSCYTVSNTLTF